MYFLALSTERAWKQRKPSSNQHTQCLDLGFLMVLYYKWNRTLWRHGRLRAGKVHDKLGMSCGARN